MASRSYFIKERRERKRELLQYIVKNSSNEEIDLTVERIIGAFSWHWGLRTAKVMEYLDELRLAGAIEINEGKIKPTEIGKALLEE